MPQLTRTNEPKASVLLPMQEVVFSLVLMSGVDVLLSSERRAPVMVALARVFTSSHSEQSR